MHFLWVQSRAEKCFPAKSKCLWRCNPCNGQRVQLLNFATSIPSVKTPTFLIFNWLIETIPSQLPAVFKTTSNESVNISRAKLFSIVAAVWALTRAWYSACFVGRPSHSHELLERQSPFTNVCLPVANGACTNSSNTSVCWLSKSPFPHQGLPQQIACLFDPLASLKGSNASIQKCLKGLLRALRCPT